MGRIRTRHDMSLSGWCTTNGFDRYQMRAALVGTSRTPKAREYLEAAMRAAGLIPGDEQNGDETR